MQLSADLPNTGSPQPGEGPGLALELADLAMAVQPDLANPLAVSAVIAGRQRRSGSCRRHWTRGR
jgi:hypothetical protein